MPTPAAAEKICELPPPIFASTDGVQSPRSALFALVGGRIFPADRVEDAGSFARWRLSPFLCTTGPPKPVQGFQSFGNSAAKPPPTLFPEIEAAPPAFFASQGSPPVPPIIKNGPYQLSILPEIFISRGNIADLPPVMRFGGGPMMNPSPPDYLFVTFLAFLWPALLLLFLRLSLQAERSSAIHADVSLFRPSRSALTSPGLMAEEEINPFGGAVMGPPSPCCDCRKILFPFRPGRLDQRCGAGWSLLMGEISSSRTQLNIRRVLHAKTHACRSAHALEPASCNHCNLPHFSISPGHYQNPFFFFFSPVGTSGCSSNLVKEKDSPPFSLPILLLARCSVPAKPLPANSGASAFPPLAPIPFPPPLCLETFPLRTFSVCP